MPPQNNPVSIARESFTMGKDSGDKIFRLLALVMTALYAINRRMGRDTVFYAGSGIRRDWMAFANMKSRHFTTDWRVMITVTS
jgi:hypothetical protein